MMRCHWSGRRRRSWLRPRADCQSAVALGHRGKVARIARRGVHGRRRRRVSHGLGPRPPAGRSDCACCSTPLHRQMSRRHFRAFSARQRSKVLACASDLAYLEQPWRDFPHDHALRRICVVSRLVLVDGEITQVWRLIGLSHRALRVLSTRPRAPRRRQSVNPREPLLKAYSSIQWRLRGSRGRILKMPGWTVSACRPMVAVKA